MGNIVGLAEYYDNPKKMRASVFASRASSTWKCLTRTLADRARIPKNISCWNYYEARESPLRHPDKFGLALWDTLSFGTIPFTEGVPEDEYLSEEFGCRHSYHLKTAQVIAGLWICTAAKADKATLDSIPLPPHKVFQSNLRKWYDEIGRILGLDATFKAWAEGVPLGDLISPEEAYMYMPGGVEVHGLGY